MKFKILAFILFILSSCNVGSSYKLSGQEEKTEGIQVEYGKLQFDNIVK